MAASRKEYEMLFSLTAKLASSFGGSFTSASKQINKLQDTMKKLHTTAGQITSFQKQAEAVEKSEKKLADLKKQAEKLNEEFKSGKKSPEEYAEANDKLQQKIETATRKLDAQKDSLKTLETKLKDAGVKTTNLAEENKKLTKTLEDVAKAQKNLDDIHAAQEANKAAISETKTELLKTTAAITGIGTALWVGAVQPAIEYESAFAGVKKTVNATDEELANISSQFREMSTAIPVSAVELAQLGEAAGQLGIKTENIVEFTRTMADLGVATNLGGAEGAATLAQYANITKMSQGDFDRLGSTIVALGNNFATTEADIAEMAMRLAGSGSQIGLSDSQILGFSAALSSVGIEAQAGGTAFSKTMKSMQLAAEFSGDVQNVIEETGMSIRDFVMMKDSDGKGYKALAHDLGMTGEELTALVKHGQELEDFARVSGLTAEQFGDAFKTDAAGAISTFVTGLSKMDENGVSAIATLEEMGFTEVRLSDTLLRAQNAEALFADAVGMADKAWEDNNALANEAAQRYETTESKITMAKNSLQEFVRTIGDQILPIIPIVTEKATELFGKITNFVQENPEVVKQIGLVAAGLAGLKVSSLVGKLGFQEIQGGVLKVSEIFGMFKMKNAEAAAAALTGGGKFAQLGKSIGGYFGGIGKSVGEVGTSLSKFNIMDKLGGAVKGGASNVLKPFQAIGDKIGGFFSPGIKQITGELSGMGKWIAGGPIGKIGGVFQSMGGVVGQVAGGPLKLLGKGFGGLFGKIMPIIAIASILAALFVKLNGGDISAFIEPLKQAFEDAKPILTNIMEQFKDLAAEILPMLMDAAVQLLPLFGQLVQGILPILLDVIAQLTPMIITIIQSLLPVILNIMTQLLPVFTQLITDILPIVLTLVQTLLPIITQLVTAVLPIIAEVISALLPIVSQLITTLADLLLPIFEALMPVIKVLADIFSAVLGAAIEGIKPVIDSIMKVFQGLIDFITGVFSGDWSKAWNGIKDIFGGIFEGLVNLIKAPINAIIGGINSVFSSIGSITIPKWVPGLAGKTFSLPQIPLLAKGALRTPDTFIAGERGAELITNAKNRTVFTAAQTRDIMGNINAREREGRATSLDLSPSTYKTSNNSDVTKTVTFAPQITVNGGNGNPTDIAEAVRAAIEKAMPGLVARIERAQYDRAEKELRMAYA